MRVRAARVGGHEPMRLWRIERAQIQALHLGRTRTDPEDEATAIGQEIREPMAQFTWRWACDGCWRAARCGHTKESTDDVRRKQDDAVATPGTAAPVGRVGQFLRFSTREIEAFQFGVGEKPIARLSGAQNGNVAPSVLGRGWAVV